VTSVRWRPAAVVAGLVLVASLVPLSGGRASQSPFVLAHLLGYAALAASLAVATDSVDRPPRVRLVGVALAAVVFGALIEAGQALIEAGQSLVPGRAYSTGDVMMNGLGAVVGVAGWLLVDRLRG
jgi:VanZ family protein